MHTAHTEKTLLPGGFPLIVLILRKRISSNF